MSPQEKICTGIRERIRNAELKPGMRLPSHRELSKKYDVAIATVTRALSRLKTEGVVECRSGSGTFVAPQQEPGIGENNRKILIINPGNETNNHTLVYAVNEVFFGTQWEVESRCACANLAWYASFLKACRKNPPAGLLIPAVSPEFFNYTEEMLPHPETKTVLIGSALPDTLTDIVCSNAFGEGLILGDYILNNGFSDFLYITPSTDQEKPEGETLRGLKLVLKRHGINFDNANIRRYTDRYSYGPSPDPVRSAFEYTIQLLRSGEKPELILAGHDWVALGVYRALLASGVKVPEQISLISAARGEIRELNPGMPRITTFDTLYYHQARVAAELLLSRLQGADGPPQHHEIHGTLIAGDTVRKEKELLNYQQEMKIKSKRK